MNSIMLGIGSAITIFAGGMIGLWLQRSVPDHFTKEGPRDMLSSVVSLVTLLVALVLGLLVWTAHGVYTAQKTSIQTIAINALAFDGALQQFGPLTIDARKFNKTALERTVERTWGGRSGTDFIVSTYRDALADRREREALVDALRPSSDREKAAAAAAAQAAAAIAQTRAQMAIALIDPMSYPLIGIVVAWATCLFCGYGLLSRFHAMSVIALGVGALAVASALYIIVDFTVPFSGLLQVSPAPLLEVIRSIDVEAK